MAFCRFCGKEIKGDHCDCPKALEEAARLMEEENQRQDETYRGAGHERAYNQGQNYGGAQNYNQGQDYSGDQNYNQGQDYSGGQNYNQDPGYNQSNAYSQNYKYDQAYENNNFRRDPFFISFSNFDFSSLRNFIHSFKRGTGITESDRVGRNSYERDVPIVPDCVKQEENEYVVKQYNLAILKNPLTFMKSEGRLMVTNRRLLFRAAGSGLTGRLLQEHQFVLDEIGGVEIHKDNIFSFWKLLLSLLASIFVAGWPFALLSGMNPASISPILLIMGILGILPSIFIYKHFFLKLMCSAFSLSCFSIMRQLSFVNNLFNRRGDSGGGLETILILIGLVIFIINLVIVCVIPNLVFKIKTKGAGEALMIASRRALGKNNRGTYSGFSEVRPWEDTDLAINELGTMIEDLQKHGDYALEKWTGGNYVH